VERASGSAGICQNRKIKRKYVDCLTYKNIVWPLSSYENQSNAKNKIVSEKKIKVQGKKVRVTTNRDDCDHHLTKFGSRIQEKKIVPAEKKKILKGY